MNILTYLEKQDMRKYNHSVSANTIFSSQIMTVYV